MEKEIYLHLSNKILAEAYEILAGNQGSISEEWVANEMRSLLKEEMRSAYSIWSYKKCWEYLSQFVCDQ